MPSETERQRRFMGADYARAKRGEKTRTGMSIDQLRDFASKTKSRGVVKRMLKRGDGHGR
jgi:hypothetical protein